MSERDHPRKICMSGERCRGLSYVETNVIYG